MIDKLVAEGNDPKEITKILWGLQTLVPVYRRERAPSVQMDRWA